MYVRTDTTCTHTHALTTPTHTRIHQSLLKHKRAYVRWHTCMHARWHNSMETNDAHPVNRNYNCMMGNFIVPARVSDVTFVFLVCFKLLLKLCNKLSMFFFFKRLVNMSPVTNMNVVWTQNSHERIIFYQGCF